MWGGVRKELGVPGGAGRLEVGEVGEGGSEVRENVGRDLWRRWLLGLRFGRESRRGEAEVGSGLEDVRVGDQGRDSLDRVCVCVRRVGLGIIPEPFAIP